VRSDPPGHRLFAWLLLAYPRRFRAQFDVGMRDAFDHDRAAACRRGRAAALAFWPLTIAQMLAAGFGERVRHAVSGLRRFTMSLFAFADWRDAIRSLRATPAITAVAVISLALGIGANTALFSILNGLLFKQLPVSEPARLLHLTGGSWTYPIWEQIRERQSLFDGAFAWANRRFDLAEGGESQFVDGAYVSGRALDVLGVAPILGRTLNDRDDARGGGADGPVAVISHRYWQRQFSGAPDVVGRSLTIQRVKVVIVGVMPAGFFGPDVGRLTDVMLPFGAEPVIRADESELDGRSVWWLEIWARLKPNQTLADANAALQGVQPQIRAATLPRNWNAQDQATYLNVPFEFEIAATGRSPMRARYSQPLTTLLVVVGLVLAIACANIANLTIARATSRRHELSIRLALGASRWRIARQLLLETAVVAAIGAVAGLLFARWASVALVRQLATTNFAPWIDVSLDWRVLAFTVAVTALTAMLFGLAPAIGARHLEANEALKERGRGAATGGRATLRHALVVAQVALSLTLVVAAALFVRTFWSLTSSPVGFEVDPVLVVDLDIEKAGVAPDQRALLFERLRDAAARAPGAAGAVASFMTPVSGSGWNTMLELPAGVPEPVGRDRYPWINAVTPGFFGLYGMRLVAGRDFDANDRVGAPAVVVVNETFARRFLKPGNPLGQLVREKSNPTFTEYQVVGVVEDTIYNSLRAGRQAIMYRPDAQLESHGPSLSLSVRAASGAADAASFSRDVAAALIAVNRDIAINLRPLSRQVGQSVTQERLIALLSGFFGLLALLLAGLGLYGVTAHGVARRRAEIGIRMALGARPAGIVTLVLGRVGWTVGAGVAAGALLSWWASRYVATLLYSVDARDPITFALAALVLMTTAGIAAWLPARRAASIDPTTALRAE
jgi:predicted permease